MAGGDGRGGDWRGGFNGPRGWQSQQNHGGVPWPEGGGPGFYGQPDHYGFEQPPPPEFGYGRGGPQSGMPYNQQPQPWNYQGPQYPPQNANLGTNQQGPGRFDSRGQIQRGGPSAAQGGSNARALVQKTNSAGSANSGMYSTKANSSDSSKGGDKSVAVVNSADSSEVKGPACFRCNLTGHVLKDCKTLLFCIHCRRHEAHISERCGMLNKIPPVVKLVGCANEGLQMLVAQTGRKNANDKRNQATGLILVLQGVLSVEQLEKALGVQFPWGGKWKVKAHGNNSYLVNFPSITRLQELCGYPMFGLRGTKATVKVTKWSPASNAIFKLHSVWVRISGIPASLLHRDGFAEAASMIGTLQDVDMEGYNSTETIRVKCGVRDPSKIPEVGELTDDPYTYLIYFELEEIVEEGGRMVDGELVRQDGTQRDRMDTGDGDRTAKRTKNMGFDKGEAGSSKNTDEEMVPSSQPEVDKEREEGLRQVMLQKITASKQIQQKEVTTDLFMEEIANSNVCYDDSGILQKTRGDNEESNSNEDGTSASMEDSDDDPENFARKAGLSTQAIKKINAEVEEEMKADELEEKEEQQCNEGDQMKNKESVIEETRRRPGRGNTEQNMVEKAKDRAKLRNLEGPAEAKTAKHTAQRSRAVGVGGY